MSTTENKHCLPCENIGKALTQDEVIAAIAKLESGWQVDDNYKIIHKDFHFKNYYQTMAFVNAIAWMAHYENHHPDLEVGYNHCLVRYTTHALGGLSPNDFVCAAAVDELIKPFQERVYVRK